MVDPNATALRFEGKAALVHLRDAVHIGDAVHYGFVGRIERRGRDGILLRCAHKLFFIPLSNVAAVELLSLSEVKQKIQELEKQLGSA